MPYTPYNREQEEFKGGIQILASQDFSYTPEGGTIDAAEVGAVYVPVGTPFVQDVATGRYVPYNDADHTTTGALNAGFRDPVLCNVDFQCDGVHNVVVGELLRKATVYPKKLPASVTATFMTLNPHIFYEYRGFNA